MKPRVWSARLLMAGCALIGTNPAWSQEANPYALSVYGTVSYQPNVFQVANGDERTSDTIATVGVNFGVKQTFDNVNLFANGNVQSNTYQNTSDLNSPSYNVNLGLGTNGERLGTTLRYSASQSLGNYGTPNVAQTTERNLQTTQDAGFALRYRMTPRTSLVGGIGYQSVSFSASAFDAQENSVGVGTIDLTHQLDPSLRAGVGLRYSSGRTPRYQQGPTSGSFIEDEFDGKYLDLLAAWQLGSANALNARFSLTRVTHTQATQLNFTGLTGIVSWTYAASSRLAVTASLLQNTGSGPNLVGLLSPASANGAAPEGASATGTGTSGSAGPGNAPSGSAGGPAAGGAPGAAPAGSAATTNPVDNNRLNTTFNLAATYQASRTIDLNGSLSVNNADLTNAADVSGNAWSTVLGLGIGYMPSRSVSLSCSITITLQNANQSAEASGQAYSYRSPSTQCTAQFSFL